MTWQIHEGDALTRLREMDAESVQTCITSPPYWGLRDYGTASWDGGDSECDHAPRAAPRESRPESGLTGGKATVDAGTIQRGDCRCGATRIDSQLGLEPTPEQYVANLVEVFREVRRVLRDDGTLWLNLGDSYNGYPANIKQGGPLSGRNQHARHFKESGYGLAAKDLKQKDLVGIPWMVAFALRADGWYLRSDIIWAKPNPMPESVTDRPTKSHEYIFLLSKSPRYFYDADAIRESATYDGPNGAQQSPYAQGFGRRSPEEEAERRVKNRTVRPGIDHNGGGQGNGAMSYPLHSRNKRSVWTVTTQPFLGAHFATFPPKLIEPCVLAGAAEGNTVLDPFAGAGTTGVVALRHNRAFVGIELNPEYAAMARARIRDDAPLFNVASEIGDR